MNYQLAYTIGFHPWEDAARDATFLATFDRLVSREEQGRVRPFGRALDLGTGSGIWAIALARRGWAVTGVDLVPKALDRARARVREAGADVHVLEGDVTAMGSSAIGTGFRLILDTGTFHDFGEAQRLGMARGVDRAASDDATMLLLAWPRRRRPLIRGVSRAEIEAAFQGWIITDVEPSNLHLPKPLELLLRPDEHWYRLRRG